MSGDAPSFRKGHDRLFGEVPLFVELPAADMGGALGLHADDDVAEIGEGHGQIVFTRNRRMKGVAVVYTKQGQSLARRMPLRIQVVFV